MSMGRRDFLSSIAALPFHPPPSAGPGARSAGLSPFGGGALSPFRALEPRRRAAAIAIDPGHGGHDPGCIGRAGTLEKQVVLEVALTMAEIMDRHGAVRPILTRSDDRFLTIPRRVALAHRAGARLLLSIHADSAPTTLARGASAYTLAATASDRFAAAIARRENRGGDAESPAPHRTAATLLALQSARHLQRRLIEGLGRQIRILENPIRAADFAVLKSGPIPAVLLELGFLSNRADERLLRDPDWRRTVALLLAAELAGFALEMPATAATGQSG